MIFFSFLFRKSLIVCSGSNLIFAILLLISLQVHFICFVKRKEISTIEQRKFKGHKKRDQIPVSKMDFPSEIKILPTDPVFSNWVSFIKKVSIIRNSSGIIQFKSICK